MPADTVKRLQVTFTTSLPMGERGTFTHDGDLWIAYRASKNQRIFAIIDRMLGIHARIEQDMVRWINIWPDDAARVAEVLKHSARARKLVNELKTEKREGQTS